MRNLSKIFWGSENTKQIVCKHDRVKKNVCRKVRSKSSEILLSDTKANTAENKCLFLWFGYTIQLFHLAFVNSSQKDLDTFFLQVFYKILNIGLFLWLVCGCLIAILLTSFWCRYWWSGGGNPHICDFLLFWIFGMFSFCYFQQKHVSFVELILLQ